MTDATIRLRAPVAILVVGLVMLRGCGDGDGETATRAPLHFTDVTADTGIAVTMTSGRSPSTQILEVKGGGVAVIDFDDDGDLDVFVPNGATLDDTENGPGCHLLENRGGMKFRDVTTAAGLTLRRWSFGVAVGDYDGDGHDDLHVACYGPDVLLRNTGDGRLVDVTATAGLGADGWGTSCAFGDIDRDGDLDLYVARYLEFDPRSPPAPTTYMGVKVLGGPFGLTPCHDVLWENLGDGSFRDISESSGCRSVPASYGLNVVILDFDRDGWQDIYVANDSMANFLLRNLGGGRFEEIGLASGAALNVDGAAQATMGVAVGDVDGNGFPDLFTTNFSSDTNTLHLNLDGSFFADRTARHGLGKVSSTLVGWASVFCDFDHDGDEDLLVFNGHVYPEASPGALDSSYQQPPLLFERRGAKFIRAGAENAGAWLGRSYCARTAAIGDLDGDGDMDVIFGELNGPFRVLRNDAVGRSRGAWLVVELHDPSRPNRRAIGSRLELTADGVRQTRWIHGGGPFQSASAPVAHFAVPRRPARASLEVTWPDGTVESISPLTWNRRLAITPKS